MDSPALAATVETAPPVIPAAVQTTGETSRAPSPSDEQSSVPLAVRIVVVRRSPRQAQATPVWAVDVVARQERVIRLSSESAGLPEDVELRLWAYPVDEET